MLNQINHMRDYHASSVIIFLMLQLYFIKKLKRALFLVRMKMAFDMLNSTVTSFFGLRGVF